MAVPQCNHITDGWEQQVGVITYFGVTTIRFVFPGSMVNVVVILETPIPPAVYAHGRGWGITMPCISAVLLISPEASR